jgi:hypothetical protein
LTNTKPYIILCIIGLFGGQSPIWNTFYFVKEHLGWIALLFFIKPFVDTIFAILLINGLIFYKILLILFNIATFFVSKDNNLAFKHCYYFVMFFGLVLWIIIFTARFFDKIVIFAKEINKLLKSLLWRRKCHFGKQ